MSALIRKELVQLRAFFVAIVVLHVFGALELLLGHVDLVEPSVGLERAAQGTWIFGVLTFAAAVRAVPEDFRGGQIHFLDALPIGRARLFAAKLAALAILVAVVVVALVLGAVFDVAVLGPEVGPSALPIASIALIVAGIALAGVGLGFLFSWTGVLSWLLVVLGFTFLELVTLLVPGAWELTLGALDPLHLEASKLVLPDKLLTFWTIVGIFGIAAGGLVFRAPGDLFARLQLHGSKRLGRIGALLVAALLVLVGALSFLVGAPRLEALARGETRVTERAGLVFSYRVAEAAEADVVIAGAESLEAHVRALFPGVERPQLVVELKPPVKHAGDFAAGKLRISPGEEGRSTFVHELTHAYQWVLTDFEGGERWRFFAEGFASWVQADAGFPIEARRLERMAGLIHRAGRHHFGTLIDDRAHRAIYATEEVYPLGLVFSAAVVEAGGRTAPACLFRSIGRRVGDVGSAMGLWLRITEDCGLDLAHVVELYERRLSALAEESGPAPPEVFGRVVRRRGRLAVDVAEGPEPATLCRFRPSKDVSRQQFESATVRGGYCEVPLLQQSERKLEYQLGWERDELTLFGPWTSRPVPMDADPCKSVDCLADSGRITRWSAEPDTRAIAPLGGAWGHGAEISTADFSDDGRLLVTGASAGGVRLWSAITGDLLGVWPASGEVERIELSPDASVALVVAGDEVVLRRVRDGAVLGRHGASLVRPRLHPEYAALVVSSDDGISVFDALPHRRVGAFGAPDPRSLRDGKLGREAVQAALDGAAPASRGSWLSAEGAPADLGALGLTDGERILARATDGRFFVAHRWTGVGRIIDAGGATRARFEGVRRFGAPSIAGPSDVALVMAGHVAFVDARTCTIARAVPWPHAGPAVVSRDGARIFTVEDEGAVLELDGEGDLVARSDVGIQPARTLRLTDDGNYLVAWGRSGLEVFDVEAKSLRWLTKSEAVTGLEVHGRTVVWRDGGLHVAQLDRLEVRTSTTIRGHAFAIDGPVLLAGRHGRITFAALDTLQAERELVGFAGVVSVVEVVGDRLIAATSTGELYEASLEPGRVARRLGQVHAGPVQHGFHLPGPKLFVTTGSDGLFASWDLEGGALRCATLFDRTGAPRSVTHLPSP